MAEIGGEEVEAYSEGAFWGVVVDGDPRHGKAIKGSRLEFHSGPALDFSATDLAGVNKFNGLQTTSSLVRLIRATAFLPELPASARALSLLLIFKGDANERPVFERAGGGDVEDVKMKSKCC